MFSSPAYLSIRYINKKSTTIPPNICAMKTDVFTDAPPNQPRSTIAYTYNTIQATGTKTDAKKVSLSFSFLNVRPPLCLFFKIADTKKMSTHLSQHF